MFDRGCAVNLSEISMIGIINYLTLSDIYAELLAEQFADVFADALDGVASLVSQFVHSVQENMSLVTVMTATFILIIEIT